MGCTAGRFQKFDPLACRQFFRLPANCSPTGARFTLALVTGAGISGTERRSKTRGDYAHKPFDRIAELTVASGVEPMIGFGRARVHRMAEFEQLRRRVEALERDCTPPYSDEHASQVGNLIADMRRQLADGGILGQWEELELSRAEVARQNNMLALAVFRASKALALHLLPASEYAAGLSTSG